MKSAKRLIFRLLIAAAALISVVGLGVLTSGQQLGLRSIGIPDDWSHHHLVFSSPGTAAQALATGHVREWYRVVNDPRYQIQTMKRAGADDAPVSSRRTPGAPLLMGVSEFAGASRSRPPTGKINKDWSMSLAGSGTGTVGAGQYPAKFSFNGTANGSCTDFVVYNTGVTGGASQPTIIAYNNLYSGCATHVPTILWQYNTAYAANPNETTFDSSTITTSVVFTGPLGVPSPALAFVQNTGSQASLVLLKVASNSSLVTMNTSTNNVAPNAYWNCTVPCMTRINFGSTTSTNSSPFYDYSNDALYVGDDGGVLHKFQYVYQNYSTTYPQEVTSGWPVTIKASSVLTSPVPDPISGNVFVGAVVSTGTYAGYVNAASGGTPTVTTSAVMSSTGTVDAPIVDTVPATPTVYYFGYDGTAKVTAVWQFAHNFGSSSTGTERTLGSAGGSTVVVYDGSFDNAHYGGDGTTGHLYVCGTASGNGSSHKPSTLYGIAFPFTTSSTLTSSTLTATNVTTPSCSPVTEIPNGTHDWLFVSVSASGGQTNCSGACLYNYDVATSLGTNATTGLAITGGTSAVIVDNNGSSKGSNVYFSSLGTASCAGNGSTGSGTNGCAYQATQAGLGD